MELKRKTRIVLWCLLAAAPGAGEALAQEPRCAGSSQGFFPSNTGDSIRFAAGEIRGAADPNGKPLAPLLADCDNDGKLEVVIPSSENPDAPAAIVFNADACGARRPVEVEIRARQGSKTVWTAFLDTGAQVDQETVADAAFAERAIVLSAASGTIERITILGGQVCLEDLCWSCEPGLRTGVALPDRAVVAGGPPVRSSVRLDAQEPVAALQLALRWEPPEAIEMVGIEPGLAVPRDRLQSFLVKVEDPQVGLKFGEATVGLLLDPSETMGPWENLEVLQIALRARGGAKPGQTARLCLVDGLGEPPLASVIFVPGQGQLVSVRLPSTCATVTITGDVSPPVLHCPEALAADGTPTGAVVEYDASASDDSGQVTVTCDPPPGSRFPVGASRVTCRARDPAGNETSCSFEVTVRAPRFLRGDVNQDGGIDISDAVNTLAYLVIGFAEPGCLSSADSNDDGRLDISDVTATLSYLFIGGAKPPPPLGTCGVDPTPDSLTCFSHRACSPGPEPALGSPLDRFLAGIPRGPQPEPPTFPELRRSQKLPREHVAIEQGQGGALQGTRLRYWNGSLDLQDPAALGQPFQVVRLENGNKVADTWYRLPGGRFTRPLVNAQNQRRGFVSIDSRASLVALDVDGDGAADVVDLDEREEGGSTQVQLLTAEPGLGFLEAALGALDPRAGRNPLTGEFDLAGGLARVLGVRASDPSPAYDGVGETTLFGGLLARLSASPASLDLGQFSPALPDFPLTTPVPTLNDRVAGVLDRPVIEIFTSSIEPCSAAHDPDRQLLSYRVVPGREGVGIQRIKITAVNLDDGAHTILDLSAPGGAPWTVAEASAVPDPRPDGRLTEAYLLAAWDSRGRAMSQRMPFSYAVTPRFEIAGEVKEGWAMGRWEYQVDALVAVDVGDVCARPQVAGSIGDRCLEAVFDVPREKVLFCSPIRLSTMSTRIIYEAHGPNACEETKVQRSAAIVRSDSLLALHCGEVDFFPIFYPGLDEDNRDFVGVAVVNAGTIGAGTDILVTADSGVFVRQASPLVLPSSYPSFIPLIRPLWPVGVISLTLEGRQATSFVVTVDPDDVSAELDEANNQIVCLWNGSRWVCAP